MMHPDYVLIAKFISIAFLFFTTAKFLTDGRFAARSLAFALFTLSVAGYLGCQVCHALHAAPWLTYLIHVGCFMVPWAFYLMNDALFEDRFRFRWIHLVSFLFIEFVHFYLITYLRVYDASQSGYAGDYINLLRAIPKLVAFAYILAALLKTFSHRRRDLVEERRRLRLQFIAINAAYMFLVLVVELALQGKQAPELIEALHAAGILLTVVYFMTRIFSVRGNVWGAIAAPASRANLENATAPVDQALLQRLQLAMEKDKVYMQENLSIRALAGLLGVHEYLLRRLINGGLGYRNFNDYLNELRIKEAARILVDKEQASTPVIRIAMDLGFGSLAPFNRAFKERMQMTPTEFRKKS